MEQSQQSHAFGALLAQLEGAEQSNDEWERGLRRKQLANESLRQELSAQQGQTEHFKVQVADARAEVCHLQEKLATVKAQCAEQEQGQREVYLQLVSAEREVSDNQNQHDQVVSTFASSLQTLNKQYRDEREKALLPEP
jgi:predicted  nucleic acid-binding Zn-ribbon protein